MLLAPALAAASILWLLLLAFAAACPFPAADSFCEIIFRVCSYVCHQKPERSFHWGASAWPVCARCLGLYSAAPAAALLALRLRGRSVFGAPGRNFLVLCLAATPTVATWFAEHAIRMSMTNAARFAAALPLGAAVAWLLVYTLQDARRR